MRSSISTTSRPNGTRAAPAILKLPTPSGMPMIVMHKSTPTTRCSSASHQPANRNHRMLPTGPEARMSRSRPGEDASERPERVSRELEDLCRKRDSDDRYSEEHPSDHVANRQPGAGEDEPDDVEEQSHSTPRGRATYSRVGFGRLGSAQVSARRDPHRSLGPASGRSARTGSRPRA